MADTCGTCRFVTNPDYQYLDHVCRRHAPVAARTEPGCLTGVWPGVAWNNWCGDHEPKETPDAG